MHAEFLVSLGKTVQTLVRIFEGRAKKSDKKAGLSASTLVVCPVALVSQWVAETKKYTPTLKVKEHHGPSRTSGALVLCNNRKSLPTVLF
jgi:SNF2 family DNA or RNA helicase